MKSIEFTRNDWQKKGQWRFSIWEGANAFYPGLVIGPRVFDIRIFGFAWVWQRGLGWKLRRNPFWFKTNKV